MTKQSEHAWLDRLVQEKYADGTDTGITDISNIEMGYTHMHTEIELNLLLRGSARYFFKGRMLDVPLRRLTAFWATTPHCLVEASDDVRFLVAYAPLDSFLQWNLPEAFTHALLTGGVISSPDELSVESDACMILRWAGLNHHGNQTHRRIYLLEAEARLLRLALNYSHTESVFKPGSDGKSSEKIAKMLEFMGTHHDEPITLADIAAHAGAHPNYAITLFKKFCGMSIQRYLTQIRLSHAERDLLITDDTTATVAFNAGFSSLSQFYAEFKRKHHRSPGSYRKHLLHS